MRPTAEERAEELKAHLERSFVAMFKGCIGEIEHFIRSAPPGVDDTMPTREDLECGLYDFLTDMCYATISSARDEYSGLGFTDDPRWMPNEVRAKRFRDLEASVSASSKLLVERMKAMDENRRRDAVQNPATLAAKGVVL